MVAISLFGSPDEIYESFYYAVNGILFRRGLYIWDHFAPVVVNGVKILTTNEILPYMKNTEFEMRRFMRGKVLKSAVLLLKSWKTGHVLEEWVFTICYDDVIEYTVRYGARARFEHLVEYIDAKCDELNDLSGPCTFAVVFNFNPK